MNLFKYLSPSLSSIYYQFLQHLTWILGLKPSAGGTLKAMPASEAPNVVRIKSYINCFVKIESFKVVRVESAPLNARDSVGKTNMTARGFFFFFALGSFCLLLFL